MKEVVLGQDGYLWLVACSVRIIFVGSKGIQAKVEERPTLAGAEGAARRSSTSSSLSLHARILIAVQNVDIRCCLS